MTAIVILYAFRFPRTQVLLFFVIPMPAWVLGLMIVVLDMLGIVGMGNNTTGYVVHLGGALFGALYYQTGFRFSSLLARRWRVAGQRSAAPIASGPH